MPASRASRRVEPSRTGWTIASGDPSGAPPESIVVSCKLLGVSTERRCRARRKVCVVSGVTVSAERFFYRFNPVAEFQTFVPTRLRRPVRRERAVDTDRDRNARAIARAPTSTRAFSLHGAKNVNRRSGVMTLRDDTARRAKVHDDVASVDAMTHGVIDRFGRSRARCGLDARRARVGNLANWTLDRPHKSLSSPSTRATNDDAHDYTRLQDTTRHTGRASARVVASTVANAPRSRRE